MSSCVLLCNIQHVSFVCVHVCCCVLTCVLVQGNCHMCKIPRWLLDDLDTNYPARERDEELDEVKTALFTGVYDNWENKVKAKKDGTKRPIPILNKDGTTVKTRRNHAGSSIGRHLLVGFWEDFEGVDFHRAVIVWFLCVILHECSKCVLPVCCLCNVCC